MLSFDRVFAFLPNLTETQLRKVQERVDYLLTHKKDKKDRGLDLFYSSATKALQFYYSRPYARTLFTLAKTDPKTYKQLVKAYNEFQTFLYTILGRNPIVEELIRASQIFIECIAEDLVRRSIRPSLLTVLTNVSSFPMLLERNFPGYVEAGAAHFIFEGPDRFDKKKLKAEKNSKEG